MSASNIWRSVSNTTSSTSTSTFGALKISTPTAIGYKTTSTAGSGVPTPAPLPATATGRLIVTETGSGVRRMAGRGLVTSLGAGRLITTAVGSTSTITGRGVRAAGFITIAVGGDRRSSRLCRSTSRSQTLSAGIRSRITSAIRTRITIVTVIGGRATALHATARLITGTKKPGAE